MFNQAKLVKEILSQFKINKRGVHGPSHWARVKHHGLTIGEQVGADLEVIKLFAFYTTAKGSVNTEILSMA